LAGTNDLAHSACQWRRKKSFITVTLDVAEEPDGGGQFERDADALRGQADREEQAGRSKIINII
jgi:hypothetical protein